MSEVKNIGRLYYLEPNNISGKIPGGIPFPYEDYCVSVDLTVETFSRNVCGFPDDDQTTKVTYSSHNGTISFIGGTEGYLTTSYTDISPFNVGSGNKECLGIESINISYNSWFYPEVVIKFIDVRGASLMTPESEGLNDAVRSGSKVTTSGSFFKSLFSFPYPKFTLKVKGFYGKEVTYELAVSKFNSDFDARVGGFVVTVNFIGYMYGVYADLPLNIVGCAPYLDYGGQHYWNTADFRYDNNTKIKTLPELHSAIGLANLRANKIDGNSSSQVNANGYKNLLNEANKIKNLFEYIRNQINKFGHLDGLKYPNVDASETFVRLFRLQPIGSTSTYLIAKNDDETFVSKVVNFVAEISQFNRDVNSSDMMLNYPYLLDNGENVTPDGLWGERLATKTETIGTVEQEVGCLGVNVTVPGLTGGEKDRILYGLRLSDNGFLGKIETIIKELEAKVENANEELQDVYKENFERLLGFSPTISNIYKTIFAQIDAFMTLFHTCLSNIKASGRKIIDYSPSGDLLTWDVQSKNSSHSAVDSMLPPFPMFSRWESNKWVNVWPGSLGSQYRELEEVKFTESLVRAAQAYGQAEKDAETAIKNAGREDSDSSVSNETGEMNAERGLFIPLTKYDITHTSIQKNPYSEWSATFFGNFVDMQNNLISMVSERYAYSIASQSDIEIFLKCEAKNFHLVNPITSIPKSFGKVLTNLSDANNLKNYLDQNDTGSSNVFTVIEKLMSQNGPICKSNLKMDDVFAGLSGGIKNVDENAFIIPNGSGSKFVILGRNVFSTIVDSVKANVEEVDDNYGYDLFHLLHNNEYVFSYIIDNQGFGKPLFVRKNDKFIQPGLSVYGKNGDGNVFIDQNLLFSTPHTDYNRETSAENGWKYFIEAKGNDDTGYEVSPTEEWFVPQMGLIGGISTGIASLFASPFYYLQSNKFNRAYLFAQTFPDMSLTFAKDLGKGYGQPELLCALIKEGSYYWRKRRVENKKDDMLFTLSITKNIDGSENTETIKWKSDVVDGQLRSLDVKGNMFAEILFDGDERNYESFNYQNASDNRKRVLEDLFISWADGASESGILTNFNENHLFPKIQSVYELFSSLDSESDAALLYDYMEKWDGCSSISEVDNNIIGELFPSTSVARNTYTYVGKVKDTKNGLLLSMDSKSENAIDIAAFYGAVADTIDEDTLPNYNGLIKNFGESNQYYKDIAIFFKELMKLYQKDQKDYNAGWMTGGSVEADDTGLDKDICLSTYMVLKNLYDRWIATKSVNDWKLSNAEGEFSKFKFVDAYYNDIGGRLVVNTTHVDAEISKMVPTLNTNTTNGSTSYNNVSVLSFLSNVASKNGMVLMCLPLDMFTKNAMLDFSTIFTPKSFMTGTGGKDTSSYVCIYSSRPSSKLNIEDDSGDNMYVDDGFTVADATGNIEEAGEKLFGLNDEGGGNPVSVFGVTYAKQNQSYFKNISVGMENPQVTEASIAATMNIAAAANDEPRAPISFGQDLYRVYSDYSYTCKVDMFGCAQILPLMYFQLNNIPLFRGVYMITKVEHTISPGDMTTSFTGVRIARDKVPFREASMIYPQENGKLSSNGNVVGNDTVNPSADTNYPGSKTDGSDTVLENGTVTWSQLLHTNSGYNNSITPALNQSADAIRENLVTLTKNVLEKVKDCEYYNRINCAYRSPIVNNATANASRTSDHMRGCAVDIGVKGGTRDNAVKLAEWCKNNLDDWGQIIIYNTFCHISYGGYYAGKKLIQQYAEDGTYPNYVFGEKK